jgi:hypothetical protein
MYLTPQGANPQVKLRELELRIDALESRINTFEKIAQALQYADKPKIGRPPKVKDERPESGD